MLATVGVVTWRTTLRLMRGTELVSQSRDVIEVDGRLMLSIAELESAWRGYLLSGNEPYLEHSRLVKGEIVATLEILKISLGERPDQTARLDSLENLLNHCFALYAQETEAFRKQGLGAGSVLLESPELKKCHEDIRQVYASMNVSERQELYRRVALTRKSGDATTSVVTLGTTLAVLVLLGAGKVILGDVAARRRAEDALAEQHNLLSSIIDALPDQVFVKDLNGRYIMDNRAHREFLHLAPGESIEGKTAFDLFPNAAAVLSHASEQEVFETGRAIRNREESTVSGGGAEAWLSTNKVALWDSGGRIMGLVGVGSDITERKESEEQLKRFSGQLERSNAELQSFASVASHDLQEPLRKILAFGDRLRIKCAPQLGEVGLDYLGRMQNAAQRMSVLIQDLLKLTRVTSRAQPFERCELSSVLCAVISDLEVAIEQSAAIIRVGPLPNVLGDPVQLGQLFQNLLSNALKFQRPGLAPEIRVEAAPALDPNGLAAGETWEIFVRDNGIGFESKFEEQIFVVFQRLHSRSEYEGTGIGLALCRKITDRHSGSIVAKSTEGQGATFIVTLPVAAPTSPLHE